MDHLMGHDSVKALITPLTMNPLHAHMRASLELTDNRRKFTNRLANQQKLRFSDVIKALKVVFYARCSCASGEKFSIFRQVIKLAYISILDDFVFTFRLNSQFHSIARLIFV